MMVAGTTVRPTSSAISGATAGSDRHSGPQVNLGDQGAARQLAAVRDRLVRHHRRLLELQGGGKRGPGPLLLVVEHPEPLADRVAAAAAAV